jgi:mono/diheme cytochrome c family protein
MARTGAARLAVALLGAALASGCGDRPKPLADSPGARLYVANCIACHQADGGGVPTMQPPLAGTPVTVGEPAELLAWVMYGRRPRALPAGAYHGVMPQFSYLSDAELATLLSWVRASFGNHAPPLTTDMVAAARAAHAAH